MTFVKQPINFLSSFEWTFYYSIKTKLHFFLTIMLIRINEYKEKLEKVDKKE